MNRAVIGIGSNINPKENIQKAIQEIGYSHRLIKQSTFTETRPIGFLNQPDFVNGVLLIQTTLDFNAFKSWLHQLEKKMGRKRNGNKFGPRVIDLDIVVWNGKVVDEDVYDRNFLYQAVLEVFPALNKETCKNPDG